MASYRRPTITNDPSASSAQSHAADPHALDPNLDAGCEDAVLRDELYLAIMRHFRVRLDARGAPGGPS